MYPYFRMFEQFRRVRKAPDLPIDGVHVSRHMCWPSDIDPWMEMNNGRMLTIFDLGRVPFVRRIPINKAMSERGWRMTIAGNTVRYRRRIRLFAKIDMRTRILGRDARFFYFHQTMRIRGEAASSGLFRVAVVGDTGIIPTDEVAKQMAVPEWNPALPEWVNNWITAESHRTWPPET